MSGLKERALIIVLAVVSAASVADMLADLAVGATGRHLLQEALVSGLGCAAMAWLWLDLRRQARALAALRDELAAAEAQARALDGPAQALRQRLSELIARTFTQWGLTPSEAEIGWLLLKGLSLKEIATLRQTVEKTVRQQASAIYQKAGVSGRHAFAAWFIEDYL